MIAVDREHLFEARQSFFMTAERAEHAAVIVEDVSGVGSSFQCGADELERFDVTSLLMTHDAEQMQRITLFRRCSQNRAVDLLGFVETALPVQLQRLRDVEFLSGRRLGGR